MSRNTHQSLSGRTIHAILFDFGNTLWSSADDTIWRTYEEASNQRAVAILHQHVAEEDLPTVNPVELGRMVRTTIDERVRRLKREQPWHEPEPTSTSTEALRQAGIEVEPEVAAAVFEALRIRTPNSRVLFEDVPATLVELQRRGFLLGVVTNRAWGGKIFLEDVETLGLLEHFDPKNMAISADLGIRKPNPDIFRYTLRALDVLPEEAAMVGDSLTSDISGAQSLNMFAIWKPRANFLRQGRAALDNTQEEVSHEELLAATLRVANQKRQKSAKPEIKPDLIIEHISDLLEVFIRAGEQ